VWKAEAELRAKREAEAERKAVWKADAEYRVKWEAEAEYIAKREAVDAERRAKREVAYIIDVEKKRLLEAGWRRPLPPAQPPPPRLRRFEVEWALGATIDHEWRQAHLETWYMADDHPAMQLVPRSTALRLRRLTPDGEWVIAKRDRTADKPVFVGLHIAQADLDVLMKVVQDQLTPPAWLVPCTPDELVEIQKDGDITPDRWAIIARRYEDRLWSRTEPPMLDRRHKDVNDVPYGEYDREWARSVGITDKEITALRLAYLIKCRERRKVQP
jgi:hypothetical protein